MESSRIVVVTGAGGGIGSALCKRFLKDGSTVWGIDRDEASLRRLADELGPEGFVPLCADLATEEGCALLAGELGRRAGRVDVLVNNAGYFPVRAFKDMSFREWREVTAINLDSVFLVISSLLPLLRTAGRGKIVNIGSGSTFRGNGHGQSHYVAAKSGVIGLSRCLAWELAEDGINVNVVTPGLTVTDAARATLGPALDAGRLRRAIQSELGPQDIVGAVAFLASEDAAFMTGQIVNVDGGTNMH